MHDMFVVVDGHRAAPNLGFVAWLAGRAGLGTRAAHHNQATPSRHRRHSRHGRERKIKYNTSRKYHTGKRRNEIAAE